MTSTQNTQGNLDAKTYIVQRTRERIYNQKRMGFCIDPRDRERNYGGNRQRRRGSERGEVFVFICGGCTGCQGQEEYMLSVKTQN